MESQCLLRTWRRRVDSHDHSPAEEKKEITTHHVLRNLIILRNFQLYNSRHLTISHGYHSHTFGPRLRTRTAARTAIPLLFLFSRLTVIILPLRSIRLTIRRPVRRHVFQKCPKDCNHAVPVCSAGVITQRDAERNAGFLDDVVAVPCDHEFDIFAERLPAVTAFENAVGSWRAVSFYAADYEFIDGGAEEVACLDGGIGVLDIGVW